MHAGQFRNPTSVWFGPHLKGNVNNLTKKAGFETKIETLSQMFLAPESFFLEMNSLVKLLELCSMLLNKCHKSFGESSAVW